MMVTFMAVAVVGWFLADAGAHGQTTDALRVGADAWLVGHGSGLSVRGAPLGIVPLALTALIFAGRLPLRAAGRPTTSQQVDDDRTLGVAAVIFTGLYVVVAVVTCVVVGQEDAGPGLGRAIVGSLLVAGVAGTLGMAVRHRSALDSRSSGCPAGCAPSRTALRRPSCCCSSPRRCSWP